MALPERSILGLISLGIATIQADTALLDSITEDVLGAQEGQEFKRRVRGRFTIFVYAEHPDWCAWLYRVLRRILNLGSRYLWAQEIYNVQMTGTDMIPDPRFVPENVYVRKISLSVEYEDEWEDTDNLWVAINGAAEAFLPSPGGSIGIFHEDVIGGSVHPYTE